MKMEQKCVNFVALILYNYVTFHGDQNVKFTTKY